MGVVVASVPVGAARRRRRIASLLWKLVRIVPKVYGRAVSDTAEEMRREAARIAVESRSTVTLPLVCAACSIGLSVGHSGRCGAPCACAPADAGSLWRSLDRWRPAVCRRCGGVITYSEESF